MKKTFTETSVKLKLGDKEHLLRFNIPTRRRIEQHQPGFNILEPNMPDFEIIPFLIQCAIPVEEQNWESEEEFFELFEAADTKKLELIPLAYQNAVGFTNKLMIPYISQLTNLLNDLEKGTNKI